jgi:hypothetical protein
MYATQPKESVSCYSGRPGAQARQLEGQQTLRLADILPHLTVNGHSPEVT